MNGTITIDVAIAILVMSQVAQWAGIYLNNRNAKKSLEVRMKEEAKKAQMPMCAAAAEMVKDHISLLATHSAEISSIRAEMKTMREENHQAHKDICDRLDRILMNSHGVH